ncbi:MAG: cytochrome c [Pseudomonadota bacterium]|jgi:mono/diheme cytochrome c family protein
MMFKPVLYLLTASVLMATHPARAEPDLVARGRRFAELVCSTCHRVSEDKTQIPLARDPGPAFVEIAGRSSTTDASLRAFLANDHPNMGPSARMPNPQLVDYQIEEVVAYILSLRRRP